MNEITPGVHHGLDEQVYHAHPTSLSVTGAKTLLRAPALYHYERQHPRHKDVFDFGKAAHQKVLGVGAEIVVHEFDPAKVKSPKSTNAWKDQQAEVRATGGVLLLPEENERLDAMVVQLRQHRMANRLLTEGQPEVSAFCVDEATGVLRRSRFDWHEPSGILVDYKTTICSEPDAFARSAKTFGYHMQSAWYQDIALDLGIAVRGFVFIAQEKEPPYLVSVVQLDEDSDELGRHRNRRALEMFRDCTESGIWPGYTPDDEITSISLPAWAFREESAA